MSVPGSHEGVADSDGFSLGCHENNLLAHLNSTFEPQHTGKGEPGSVADSVDSAVLDNHSLVVYKEALQGLDAPPVG